MKEGQSLTFGTASSYTDDLVRVSSSGTMTLIPNLKHHLIQIQLVEDMVI